ncbi:hypothetical protein YC2023_055248 [Brassica napus]
MRHKCVVLWSLSSSTPSKYGGVQKIELTAFIRLCFLILYDAFYFFFICGRKGGTVEFHCTGQVDDIEKTDGPMLHHQSFAYKDVVTTLEMIFWML